MRYKITTEQIETIRRQILAFEECLIHYDNCVESILYRYGSTHTERALIRRSEDGLIVLRDLLKSLPKISALEELAEQAE